MVAFNEVGQGYFTFEDLEKELVSLDREINLVSKEIQNIGDYYGIDKLNLSKEKFDKYMNIVGPLNKHHFELIKKYNDLIRLMAVIGL